MAKVAIIKLFKGLNLAPAQLAGQLQAAGHEVKVIYFKETVALPTDEAEGYLEFDYPGVGFVANGRQYSVDLFKPVSDSEEQLLVEELKAFAPDFIGFTVFSGLIKICGEVNERLRKYFDCPIIWGGPGPTLEPEKCIGFADLLCINEGEAVIVELADRLDAGADYSDITGTWCQRGEEIIKNENRPLMPLDDIAQPDWSRERYILINEGKVERNYYPENARSYPIMTQRGCPFSCHFCIESKYQDMFGRKNSLRRKSVDHIIDELLWAKKHLRVEKVMFYDDVFTVHPRWLDEFLPRYKSEINLPFWCYSYPTTHNRELLDKLKDAGCVAITMGVQSGSERVLKEHFNRPTKSDRVIAAAEEIVEAGITGFYDLITRVDFETVEDLDETFEFLLKFPLQMNTFMLPNMTSYPTYQYSEDVIAAESKGILNRPSDQDYDFYHHLYLLSRSTLLVSKIREIRNDPKYRENPSLMTEFFDHQPVMNFTDPVPKRERQSA
ncbi:MAG: B12-binding domain-containing radical SAM protein [Haliea sp.]|nr:B12-binding domain-containing radical SAM protein [Haliea sp.]